MGRHSVEGGSHRWKDTGFKKLEQYINGFSKQVGAIEYCSLLLSFHQPKNVNCTSHGLYSLSFKVHQQIILVLGEELAFAIS